MLATAHGTEQAFRTVAVVPGPPTTVLSDEAKAIADTSSRLRRVIHPVTGETVFVFAEVSSVYDGNGQLRTEFRHLTTVGPPELSTSVVLWTHDSRVISSQLDAPIAERNAVEQVEIGELLSQKRDGVTPYMETRALEGSYLDAARFVLFVLRNSADAAVVSLGEETAIVESLNYDLDAEIDVMTGELRSFGLGYSWGVKRVWFVGRMDAGLLPARHPLERRGRVVRGQDRSARMEMPVSSDATMLVYQTAVPLESVSADKFRWQTVASKLLDHSTGSVHGPDGEIDEEASAGRRDLAERMGRAAPPLTVKGPQGRLVPRQGKWTGISRIGIATSLGMILLAAAIWFRQRRLT